MPLLDLLQSNTPLFIAVMGVLGLAIGSFLNVVTYRLPKIMEAEERRYCRSLLEPGGSAAEEAPLSLSHPGSHCTRCGHRVSILENIPVLSYLFLRGRCSSCAAPIPIRYPLVESCTAVLTMIVAWHFGFGLQALFAALLTWSLIALSAIDLDCQLLPDDITLPFLWLGLVCNLFGLFTGLHSSVLGAVCGYLLLWSVYKLFKAVTGKEGMGYGDFKLLAMLGAWLGWSMLPFIILASSACGAVVGIGLMLLRGAPRSRPIPFGPYLAVAGWIALLWGPKLTAAYLRWATAA